ncbi:MAG: DMT family transporter [Bacillota bacterium]|nr:DMT family transporter [Bacillota bacterium]
MKGIRFGDLSPQRKKRLSDLSLIFVALLWGGGFVAVKDALDTVSPMWLMALRMMIAALCFYLFLHRSIGRISKSEWLKGGGVGLMLFLAFAAQTVGLQFTTASKQGFLTATYVLFVPLLCWAIDRKAPPRKVFVSGLLMMGGLALVSLGKDAAFTQGDALTLLCAVLFAMHIIAIERASRSMTSIRIAFIQFVVAAGLFLVAALIAEPFPSTLTTRSWGALFYLGILSTFVCFTLQTIAQKYTSSSNVSIFLSLEAVFAAILGVWILGEQLTLRMIFGFVLIFAAVLLTELDLKTLRDRNRNVIKRSGR